MAVVQARVSSAADERFGDRDPAWHDSSRLDAAEPFDRAGPVRLERLRRTRQHQLRQSGEGRFVASLCFRFVGRLCSPLLSSSLLFSPLLFSSL
ncbi:unnamed protein product, partial [Protopolystoma xenopodis]